MHENTLITQECIIHSLSLYDLTETYSRRTLDVVQCAIYRQAGSWK